MWLTGHMWHNWRHLLHTHTQTFDISLQHSNEFLLFFRFHSILTTPFTNDLFSWPSKIEANNICEKFKVNDNVGYFTATSFNLCLCTNKKHILGKMQHEIMSCACVLKRLSIRLLHCELFPYSLIQSYLPDFIFQSLRNLQQEYDTKANYFLSLLTGSMFCWGPEYQIQISQLVSEFHQKM
jgi:hypothetical protein